MKSEIGRFLKATLFFVPFAAVVYVILVCVWGDFAPQALRPNLKISGLHDMYSRLNEVENAKEVDILFLGSSHAYRGFDTRIFKKAGFTSFNLGSSAQTPEQTEMLLKRYLDEIKPKAIVYEVYPPTFTLDGVESALDIVTNGRNDVHSIKMAVNQNHIKVYNLLVYQFYRQLFSRRQNFTDKINTPVDDYVTGGFVERKPEFFKYVIYPSGAYDIRPVQLKAFANSIRLIKQRGIKLLLVQAPVTQSLYNAFTNNSMFDSTMIQYGRYLNFNAKVPLDDSLHFYNSNHLNQPGVELFNKKFLEIVLSEKLLR